MTSSILYATHYRSMMYHEEHAPQLWRHPPSPPPQRRRASAPAGAGADAAPLGRLGFRSPAGRVRTGRRRLQAAWDCSTWVFRHTLLQGSRASLASSSTLPYHLAPTMLLLQGQPFKAALSAAKAGPPGRQCLTSQVSNYQLSAADNLHQGVPDRVGICIELSAATPAGQQKPIPLACSQFRDSQAAGIDNTPFPPFL